MNEGAEPAQTILKRILITADAVGGVWQYTVDLARSLAQCGVSVLVAVMGPVPSEEQCSELPPEAAMVAEPYALEWTENPWSAVDAAGEWLLQLNAHFRPDLVHLNGYVHAPLPWHCPVLVVAHSCVFSWWRAVHGCEPGTAWNEYRRRVSAGLASCNLVVAPSRFMASELAAIYGNSRDSIRVIHNFTATPVTTPPAKQPFCLAAGRLWDQAKNFGLLQQVARNSPWPVCLAGGLEGTASLPDVTALGRVPYADLLARMARATLFLHPALYEPFGLAVLEAARAGCCLVLADTVSSRELWEEAACFVNPHKPEAWSSAVHRLINDPGECARLGVAAQEHSRRYNETAFRAAYMSVYTQLLSTYAKLGEAAA